MQVIVWEGFPGGQHAYNVNIFWTLILHSFIRSFSNFRFCQIRPIFTILLFWTKLKNASKHVKLALKYQMGKFFFEQQNKMFSYLNSIRGKVFIGSDSFFGHHNARTKTEAFYN